ncbi:hypothetical protein KSAC_00810 [Komagataeibacter saccharivorans]|nr:hypothetical protein KSAC_00810 [Komagataeibacter saccharivorans]
MLQWAESRLAELDRQTGLDAAKSLAGEGDLFPVVDELEDPLGDPPPSALAGATECFSSAQSLLWPLFA